MFEPFQRLGDAPAGDGVGSAWPLRAVSPRRRAAACGSRTRPAAGW